MSNRTEEGIPRSIWGWFQCWFRPVSMARESPLFSKRLLDCQCNETSLSKASNLPTSLLQRGRLVLVARNPKDALVSYYFFYRDVVAKDKLSRGNFAPPTVKPGCPPSHFVCFTI